MSNGKLKTLDTKLKPISTYLAIPDKTTDKVYLTPDHKNWRKKVMIKAGWRCQWPGCDRRSPEHRLFADHIVELKDGGDPFDVANGQALCGTHHTMKTNQARADRHGIRK